MTLTEVLLSSLTTAIFMFVYIVRTRLIELVIQSLLEFAIQLGRIYFVFLESFTRPRLHAYAQIQRAEEIAAIAREIEVRDRRIALLDQRIAEIQEGQRQAAVQ
jgi:hypothetical protein